MLHSRVVLSILRRGSTRNVSLAGASLTEQTLNKSAFQVLQNRKSSSRVEGCEKSCETFCAFVGI